MNIVGQYVESWRAPDASLQVKCPLCQHWIPQVPDASIKPDRATSQTTWLDCACMSHNGQGQHGTATDCQCVARFRLAVADTSGRYAVAGVDYQTMADRMQVREGQDSSPLECISPSGISDGGSRDKNEEGSMCDTPRPEQHFGIIKISTYLIMELLQFPKEYIPITLNLDFERRELSVMVEHPDIPVIGRDDALPEVLPTYETRVDDEGVRWTRLVHISIRERKDVNADALRKYPLRESES